MQRFQSTGNSHYFANRLTRKVLRPRTPNSAAAVKLVCVLKRKVKLRDSRTQALQS